MNRKDFLIQDCQNNLIMFMLSILLACLFILVAIVSSSTLICASCIAGMMVSSTAGFLTFNKMCEFWKELKQLKKQEEEEKAQD